MCLGVVVTSGPTATVNECLFRYLHVWQHINPSGFRYPHFLDNRMASSPRVVSLLGSTTHSEREPALDTITIVVLVAAEDDGDIGCV